MFILLISEEGGIYPKNSKFPPPQKKNHCDETIRLQPYNNSIIIIKRKLKAQINRKKVGKNTVKSLKLLPSDAFPRLKICQKCVCGRGSSPDPPGRDHSAPPDPVAGFKGLLLKKGEKGGRKDVREGEEREGKGRAKGRRGKGREEEGREGKGRGGREV